MKHIISLFAIVVVFLPGCASTHVYKEVMKEEPSYNTREFSASKDALYQAVMEVVLDKNFMIEKEDKENSFILAKRSFQKGKKSIALLLQAKITAVTDAKARVYLSAVETREANYVADRTRFFLWLVPLPGGGGKEASRVKEGEEVVSDKDFYNNLFSLVEKVLPASSSTPV
jgi:hypothetical protein